VKRSVLNLLTLLSLLVCVATGVAWALGCAGWLEPHATEWWVVSHTVFGDYACSILIGVAVLLVCCALLLLRRSRITEHNVCTRCGYDLRHVDRCPECGETVRGLTP
jgi:hypothetical protein